MLHNLNKIIIIKNNFNVEGGTAAAAYSITVQWQSTNSIALEYSVPIRRFLHFTTLRKKIKYFVLEPSNFAKHGKFRTREQNPAFEHEFSRLKTLDLRTFQSSIKYE